MDAAIENPKSSVYDELIQSELITYRSRLATTPGFPNLDWRLFKAVVLIESGGPACAAWTSRAMQFGNPSDPAYNVLRSATQGSALIMDSQLKNDIATKSISIPTLNIRAGIAYILTMAAQFGSAQMIDDPTIRQHTVQKKESLFSISRSVHTTIQDIATNNPTLGRTLRPGQVIAYQLAHMTMVITGWTPITPDFPAAYYNGNSNGQGDPNYADKIRYVYGKLPP